MFIDMLNQADFHKYDLSSAESGKRIRRRVKQKSFVFNWLRRFCAFTPGIMGGSSCPPEVIRKVMTDMNMKEIMVSGDTSGRFHVPSSM